MTAEPWRVAISRSIRPELRTLAAAVGGDAEAVLAVGRDPGTQASIARHRAAPALALRAQERGLDLPVLSQWRRELFRSAAVRAQLSEALTRVGDVLSRCAIPWMPLKGMAVDERLYPNLAERPTTDLDVLVGDASFDRAREALFASGWVPDVGSDVAPGQRPRGYNWAARDANGTRLELHFQLWGSVPADLAGEVLARATRDGRYLAGGDLPRLADMYLLHAVHAFIHAGPIPVIYWWDLERIARCAGPALVDELSARADRWGLHLFLVPGAVVADELWGGPVHRAVVTALAPGLRRPEAWLLRTVRDIERLGLRGITAARMLSRRPSRRGVRAVWTGVRRIFGR